MRSENSNRKSGRKLEEDRLNAFQMVTNYRPLLCKLMKYDYHNAQDLEQDILLKFYKRFEIQPDWWYLVQNKPAFIVRSAKNAAFNIRKNSPIVPHCVGQVDIDKCNDLPTEDNSLSQMNENLEYEPYRIRMKEILEKGFSPFEQKLIQMRFFEGCKPAYITEILINEDPELLYTEYPEFRGKGKFKRLSKCVRADCYEAEAKFLKKLNDALMD